MPDPDDLEALLADAPDDLEDEDELLEWFASQLGLDDDEVEEMTNAAAATGGIVAALAFLKLYTAGWDALDDAHDASIEAHTEDVGPELSERLSDIAEDMADDLTETLESDWGEDGSEVMRVSDFSAQSEYSESKSDADADEGWEYAKYVAEASACDVCEDCHGTVLPVDDPWWDDHEPDENHPNCKCLKVPLSEAEAKAAGISEAGPDVEVSGWKDAWPPDVTDYPDILEGIYHSKLP